MYHRPSQVLTVCCNEKFNFSKLSEYLHTYVMNATKGPSINHVDKEGGSKTFQKVHKTIAESIQKVTFFREGGLIKNPMLLYKGRRGAGGGSKQREISPNSLWMPHCPKSTLWKSL